MKLTHHPKTECSPLIYMILDDATRHRSDTGYPTYKYTDVNNLNSNEWKIRDWKGIMLTFG